MKLEDTFAFEGRRFGSKSGLFLETGRKDQHPGQ